MKDENVLSEQTFWRAMTKYDSAFAFCEVPTQRTRIILFDDFGNVMNKCNNEDFEYISIDDGYVCIHM